MPYEYKVLGQQITLEVDPTVVGVSFKGAPPNGIRAQSIEAAGAGPFAQRFDIPGENITIIPSGVPPTSGVAPTVSGDTAHSQATISSLNAQPSIAHALPVFRVSGNQVVASNRVIVGLNDLNIKLSLGGKYNLTLLRELDSKVVYQIPEGADPFTITAQLDEEVGVRFAEPDFIAVGRHLPKRNEFGVQPKIAAPPIPHQYAMSITHAVDAWTLHRGDPLVRVAILDEGVDTQHPDLQRAIVGTFDATREDNYQEPNPWDGHGTACAGLAAAAGDPVTGVRGSGINCSLLAVRIALSTFQGGPWVTTNEKIARGISWSWKNGAGILTRIRRMTHKYVEGQVRFSYDNQ